MFTRFTDGDGFASETLTYSNVGTSATLDDGNFTTTLSGSGSLADIAGSFSVTLSAFSEDGQGTQDNDPLNWTFNDPAVFDTLAASGLGISSPGNMNATNAAGEGEVFLLSFDLTNITSGAGNLQFSLGTDSEESWTVFRQTTASTAEAATVTLRPENTDPDTPTESAPVTIISAAELTPGIYNFVIGGIGEDGGGRLRFGNLNFTSAVPETSTYGLIAGLLALVATSLRRRRKT